jgi:preprotein translocase subunit YajC
MALNHVLLAAGSTGTKKKSGSSPLFFLVLIGLFAVVYIGFLRPRANRQRAAVAAKRSAEVGDEVTTTSGLIATVVAIDDDALTLEVAPGVHCRYVPAAILRVNTEDEPEPDEPDISNHEVIDDPTIVTPTGESPESGDDSAAPSPDSPDGPASN